MIRVLFCEVCGEYARAVSADTIVTDPPVADAEGNLWARKHLEGPYHYRCDNHPWTTRQKESEALALWRKQQRAGGVSCE